MADSNKWRSGDVIRYDTLTRPNRWCREGIAVAEIRHGRLVLRDTYWSGGSETHTLTETEAETGELLFNVADYDELDRYSPNSLCTWEKYAPEDRQSITEQHGCRRRWFIRKGAQPSWAQQIENAERVVQENRDELRSAEIGLQWALEDLERIRKLGVDSEASA